MYELKEVDCALMVWLRIELDFWKEGKGGHDVL